MKSCVLLLAGLGLTTVAGLAAGQTTQVMKVTGTLTSPACKVSLSDGGEVKFGSFSRAILSPTLTTAIGSRTIDANVECTAATVIAIKIADNRATDKPAGNMNVKFDQIAPGPALQVAADNLFGLGKADNGKAIGAYAIRFGTPQVDGKGVSFLANNVSTAAAGWANLAFPAALFAHSRPYIAASTSASPSAASAAIGSQFKFPMDIAPSLDVSTNIPGAGDVRFDGNATIEVLYL
ncbi:DUF1120 domain-containing protein [Collimonas humicola]|uniref:DUF1120 domain-containing protein n=1 Tax=Collimonas humicola TaxID=2825886 RepID=UPI001B8D59C0|nr:DUF1120 domain-containing protein [Collimonas humicola]